MLKVIKNKRAQVVASEYLVVIFIVIVVIGAMTVFFKRAVQARIHDARDYMVNEVRERTRGEFSGNLYRHYEPYYINQTVTVTRDAQEEKRLIGGTSSEVFSETFSELTTGIVVSNAAPPKEFDKTTPTR